MRVLLKSDEVDNEQMKIIRSSSYRFGIQERFKAVDAQHFPLGRTSACEIVQSKERLVNFDKVT